jgi:putative peptidoglycan lipid II flippase
MSGRILRGTTTVGLMTLLSRVTGLARDIVYAHLFGASALMDAFLVAFKIPNFLRRLSAEGAFSQAFVPVVSEYKTKRNDGEVRALVSGAAGTLGVVLFLVTVVGVLAAPVLIYLFAPGFKQYGNKFDMAVAMLHWTFPYIFFISLASLYGGVLNSYGKFGPPAFSTVLMNVIMVVFATSLAPWFSNPGLALAIGVFVSGLVQLAFQLPYVARLKLLGWPRWHWSHEGVKRIGRLMLPGIFGSSVAQVSLLLDTLIVSFFATGSVTWLYYADRLVEFPLGIFSIALATVILPSLSTHHAEESPEQFSATLEWALKLLVVVVLPAAVGLFTLAGPLTAALIGNGRYTAFAVQMTAYALMAYSFGLIWFSLVKVLAPGYFARQDTKTPVRAGIIALSVNMGINLLIVFPLWKFGFRYPHALIALSTGLSAMVNTWLLYRGLRRANVLRLSPGWGVLTVRVVIANLVMGAALLWLAHDLDRWMQFPTLRRVGLLLAVVAAGGLLYFGLLWILGVRYADLRVRPSPRPAPADGRG